MRIVDFINEEIHLLTERGFKKIEFLSASECTLIKNGTLESVMFEGASLDRQCSRINLSEIPERQEVKGFKIRIWGIPKRKRKGETLVYYVKREED